MKSTTNTLWQDAAADPAERLQSFRTWLFDRLATLLEWPQDKKRRQRQIGQCQQFIIEAVRDFQRHGYYFDGADLAGIIEGKLREIARYQRMGRVENIYAYCKTLWKGHVAREADQYRERSMQAGCHVDRILATRPKSIPELEAQYHRETLHERAARKRKQEQQAAQEANQQTLFD